MDVDVVAEEGLKMMKRGLFAFVVVLAFNAVACVQNVGQNVIFLDFQNCTGQCVTVSLPSSMFQYNLCPGETPEYNLGPMSSTSTVTYEVTDTNTGATLIPSTTVGTPYGGDTIPVGSGACSGDMMIYFSQAGLVGDTN